MAKFLCVFNHVGGHIYRIVTILVGFLIALSAIFTAVEAFLRLFTHASRGFIEEIPRYSLAYLVFLMLGPLIKLDRHIAVDVVGQRLKGKWKLGLSAVTHLFLLAGGCILIKSGVAAVQTCLVTGERTITEFPIPLWTLYLSLPIGGLLVVFYSVVKALAYVTSVFGNGNVQLEQEK